MISESAPASAAPRHDMPTPLAASVVLPTHGRRCSLLRVLRALDQQALDGAFEVLVVCDGDVDGSAAACRSLAPALRYHLQVIEQPQQGPAAARNKGITAARAPLVVFLDDDVLPDDGLIAAHLAAHQDNARQATIGPLLPPRDTRLSVWSAWEERVLCRQYQAMAAGHWQATWRQFYTGNAAVSTALLSEVGGFDPRYKRAEDIELALRMHEAGIHFTFLPHAKGWHHIDRSFRAWRATAGAYGEADLAIARAGRPWHLHLVRDAFRTRASAVRLLIRICAGRRILVVPAAWLLSGLVRFAQLSRATVPGHVCCSLLFNLVYFDAVARVLGGRDSFLQLLSRSIPSAAEAAGE